MLSKEQFINALIELIPPFDERGKFDRFRISNEPETISDAALVSKHEVESFLNCGWPIDYEKVIGGWTPLLTAACAHQSEILEFIIEKGAKPLSFMTLSIQGQHFKKTDFEKLVSISSASDLQKEELLSGWRDDGLLKRFSPAALEEEAQIWESRKSEFLLRTKKAEELAEKIGDGSLDEFLNLRVALEDIESYTRDYYLGQIASYFRYPALFNSLLELHASKGILSKEHLSLLQFAVVRLGTAEMCRSLTHLDIVFESKHLDEAIKECNYDVALILMEDGLLPSEDILTSPLVRRRKHYQLVQHVMKALIASGKKFGASLSCKSKASTLDKQKGVKSFLSTDLPRCVGVGAVSLGSKEIIAIFGTNPSPIDIKKETSFGSDKFLFVCALRNVPYSLVVCWGLEQSRFDSLLAQASQECTRPALSYTFSDEIGVRGFSLYEAGRHIGTIACSFNGKEELFFEKKEESFHELTSKLAGSSGFDAIQLLAKNLDLHIPRFEIKHESPKISLVLNGISRKDVNEALFLDLS